ncbi:MAG: hypothetical protein IKD52_14720 [Exiguobacterium sp.]|nr:hypothetical protein [Exiguobacterium sp.]
MSQFDIANISLSVHDEKTGTAGFVGNKDFALVLQGFFTPKDDKILEEKGFAEPSIKEQALWSAYGLFNELDVLVNGEDEMTVKFVKLLDRFISENGGWDYFEKDENK